MLEYFIGVVIAWSVIDGDTLKVDVLSFPNQVAHHEKVRLVRVDAPETDGTPCEKVLAAKATAWTAERMAAGAHVLVKVDTREPRQRDGFGRLLGDVIVDGVSLSDAGLAGGVFRPYVRPKVPWC